MIQTVITTLLALALAAIVIVRFVCLAKGVSPSAFKKAHCEIRWHGFAVSYISLALAVLFGVLDVYRTGGSQATWLFLVASAGLIVFDPRRPK